MDVQELIQSQFLKKVCHKQKWKKTVSIYTTSFLGEV